MPREVASELAPTGVLRAAINMGNFLLVTGKSPSGDPEGVSPDMAREIATRLGVPVKYVPYARPGELADDAAKGLWDIGLIGAEPQRAAVINFTAAYCEIEATYLVPPASPIRSVAEVDQPGKRIGVTARSAYGLWLENNVKQAQLLQFDSADAALKVTRWTPMPGCARACWRSRRRALARASWTASSPPCSRRSARRGKTRPARHSCATLSRRRRSRGSSLGSSNATGSSAVCRWHRRADQHADQHKELVHGDIRRKGPHL